MTKDEFENCLKHSSKIDELLSLQLAVREAGSEAKTRLDQAKADAALHGNFLPTAVYMTLTQAVRENSIQQQRIQIKLAAIKENRRDGEIRFERAFLQVARTELNHAVFEDLYRRAKEWLDRKENG